MHSNAIRVQVFFYHVYVEKCCFVYQNPLEIVLSPPHYIIWPLCPGDIDHCVIMALREVQNLSRQWIFLLKQKCSQGGLRIIKFSYQMDWTHFWPMCYRWKYVKTCIFFHFSIYFFNHALWNSVSVDGFFHVFHVNIFCCIEKFSI